MSRVNQSRKHLISTVFGRHWTLVPSGLGSYSGVSSMDRRVGDVTLPSAQGVRGMLTVVVSVTPTWGARPVSGRDLRGAEWSLGDECRGPGIRSGTPPGVRDPSRQDTGTSRSGGSGRLSCRPCDLPLGSPRTPLSTPGTPSADPIEVRDSTTH